VATRSGSPGRDPLSGGTCQRLRDRLEIIGATHTTVENDVVNAGCATDPNMPTIGVFDIDDTGATDTTSIDFNVVHSSSGGVDDHLYSWAGESFATAAALTMATGQGAHDSNADPGLTKDGTAFGSAVADSADPTAPDVPDTDMNGHARVDDPLVANSPGIVDRGAVETLDPLAATVSVAPTTVPVGRPVNALVGGHSPWAPFTGGTVDFGDGTAPVHSLGGASPGRPCPQ
jgi:hypothetical protein